MPHAFTQQFDLKPGALLDAEIEGRGLLITPSAAHRTAKPRRNRYTMDELLAQGGYAPDLPPEQREWIDAPRTGRELI